MARLSPMSICQLLAAAAALMANGCAQADLAAGFVNPPPSARPHTWWHWMNGNITREGITADLEAMQRIGLGGAQIFNVSESIPDGPVAFMSGEWRALVAHAVAEANRLGLELCIHNCAGWSSSGGPWVTPELAMQMVVVSETRLSGPGPCTAPLAQPETRCGFYRDIAVLAFPTPGDASARLADIARKAGYEAHYGQQPELVAFAPDAVVKRERIVDLSGALGTDGHLDWQVPAGDWTVLRIGYTPTGKDNHPAPESGRGLECDKLSRAALELHWAAMMAKIIGDVGTLAGKTLDNCLIDSYEVGQQNWTASFRAEFVQRRGYDLLLWLPALTGRVVDSGEASERFLWDFRRTIADLFAENYYDHFSELCHASGLSASIEPYDGPFECLRVGRGADIPMGEFWVGSGESSSCKLAASVAHIYGKTIVGAESFTADPTQGRWLNHPFALKAVGDLTYGTGINRFIVHRYAHQPWLDQEPGMTMGQWGTHFERTVTWWDQGAAWIRYLSRCQYLLQQGRFVADVCWLAAEGAPAGAPHAPELKRSGYDYDACNADVVLHHMSVQDGRLVLDNGMTYRLLVLPDTTFMTPQLCARLHDLVEAGATILGKRPLRSPSLADLGAGDALVQKLAAARWGDGAQATDHALGRGRVCAERAPQQLLAELDVPPDCEFTAAPGTPAMSFIHRLLGNTDIYFVATAAARPQLVSCTFRVTGKVPELWHPDTGAIETAPVWSAQDGRTTVPIVFDPAGSVFVVFRQSAAHVDHLVAMHAPGLPPRLLPIEIKSAVYEAIDGAGGADVTAKVVELCRAGEVSIPANNATFGDTAVNHVKRLRVDYLLGGQPLSRHADENGALELTDASQLAAMPPPRLQWSPARTLELHAFEPGPVELVRLSGARVHADVAALPTPIPIGGPWQVRFPPGRGAPSGVALDQLCSWSEHRDPGVRYFSGTAEYTTSFDVPAERLASSYVLRLDLGRVKEIAEVSVNGVDLGVWWKPPFAADVGAVLKAGSNTLVVRITNLWVNRLIGDEQHADDCEWNGAPLKRWPDWLRDGAPRPVPQRLTFTTWKHYHRDSPLLESGLLGPVQITIGRRVPIE
ncbi:MAG: glycosyl hydrolase [Planctomycetota bacterium]